MLDEAAYRLAKRATDILLAVVALPLVLPPLAICMAAIRIDSPGPVVFRQMRTGKGGRRFAMFKLRTMVRNAEEIKQRLRDKNIATWPDFALQNDPRVTRVGRLLRMTSLDELPQIFNVLTGDMSFVGPRPTSWSASAYAAWHNARLEVLPGITGLAQISGRCSVKYDDRRRLGDRLCRESLLVARPPDHRPHDQVRYHRGWSVAMLELAFWSSVGLIVYVYAGYPLLLILVGSIRNHSVAKRDITPRLSLVITAYNEQEHIGGRLENALSLDYPREALEIIVASDGSTDRTAAMVEAFADRGVTLLRFPRQGKIHALNAAVEYASGEIAVFSDATSTYDPQALRKLARNFADPEVGAVTGRPQFVPDSRAHSTAHTERAVTSTTTVS